MNEKKLQTLDRMIKKIGMNFARADSWGKDPKTMSIQEAEKELRYAARMKYGEMDGPNKKAFMERVNWIYKEHPQLKKVNVFADSSGRDEYHVEFHFEENGKRKTGSVNVQASSKSEAEKLARKKASDRGTDVTYILSVRTGPHSSSGS